MSILVAIDFSDSSSTLLNKAIELAKQSNIKLLLVHVMPVDVGVIIGDVGFEFPYAVHQDPPEDSAKAELKKLQIICEEQGVQSEVIVRKGIPYEEILKTSDEYAVEWIILSSHGHGALYEAIVGSVAHDVIKDAKVPVIVIPKKLSES